MTDRAATLSHDSLSLPADVASCHQLILEMAGQVRHLNVQIDYLRRKLFGRGSERLDGGALEFFGDNWQSAPAPVPEAPAAQDPPPSGAAARRHGGGRRPIPAAIPRQRIEHDLPEAQKICAECGTAKKCIGEETSEQLDYVPASFTVLQHACLKYACPKCQGEVAQAEKPAQPLEKALAAAGLLAHVIVSKYCDHLPLHRQERIYGRHGLELPRSTLCDWAMRSAEALEPVVKAMRSSLLQSSVIQSDDTRLPVQENGKAHNAYAWVYIGDEEHPYIIYDFTWTRSREGPQTVLADYQGYLQADAYNGYDGLFTDGRIVEVACWAHARRYFFEAKDSEPVLANQALLRVKDLYAVEHQAVERELSPELRLALRQEKSVPLLDSFGQWLSERQQTALPKSPFGKAVNYAQGNWRALRRYAEDGRLAIDNNRSERAMRQVVVGRNNWLFVGSPRGGHAAATLFSLVQSAKRQKMDPYAYLRDLLTRIPTIPQSQIKDLFPDNWKKLAEAQER